MPGSLVVDHLALLSAVAVGACTTVTMATSDDEDTHYAAASTNIASLSDVIKHNPSDPQAYNMRRARARGAL